MNRLALVGCTVVVMVCGCSELDRMAAGREEWVPTCIVQAHRGAGHLAPENTLPTFELAWQIGAVPEADVRTSRDGVMVAFHDSHFKRLVKGADAALAGRGVADLTWEELSRLDVGSYKGEAFAGQRVPKMEEVFAVMRGRAGRLLYVDIKDVDLERLAAMVRDYRIDRQVILASTDDALVRRWKELSPRSRTLLWMGGTEAKLSARLDKQREGNFKGVDQLQIHVKVGRLQDAEPFDPSSAFLRKVGGELKSRGILFQVLPMGSSDPAAYRKLMELGVESFATDDPKVAVRECGKR